MAESSWLKRQYEAVATPLVYVGIAFGALWLCGAFAPVVAHAAVAPAAGLVPPPMTGMEVMPLDPGAGGHMGMPDGGSMGAQGGMEMHNHGPSAELNNNIMDELGW